MIRRPRLTDICLVAVLAILSHAEYVFGTDVLDLPHIAGIPLAAAVPAAIDTYVIAAFRHGGRDVPWALALTVTSVSGGTMSSLVDLTTRSKLLGALAFAAVLAVVLWRVHVLEHAASAVERELDATRARLEEAAARGADLEAHLEQALATVRAGETQLQRQAVEADERIRQLTEHLTATAEEEGAARPAPVARGVTAARAPASQRPAGTTAAVVPLRPGDRATGTDEQLLAVIRRAVHANPDVGRPTVLAAIRAAGYSCGKSRADALLTRARTDHHATQPTGAAR